MGGCGSKETVDQRRRSTAIGRKIKADFNQEARVLKLLLLGAGESGKSTFYKQIIALHGNGFDEEDRLSYMAAISINIQHMVMLILEWSEKLAQEKPELETALGDSVAESKEFLSNLSEENSVFPEYVACHIRICLADAGFQKTLSLATEYRIPINDSTEYFFGRFNELSKTDFVPTFDDVVRARLRTSGIVEQGFSIEGQEFRILDVGGQRNERRKWLHAFDKVTAVLFVISLVGYSQVLYEDITTNRMHEALALFKSLVENKKVFKKVPFIVFLNKKDLFETRIKLIGLDTAFPDYSGGADYDKGIEYISEKIHGIASKAKTTAFVHITCATDTDNVRHVFDDVKDFLLNEMLGEKGIGLE